MVLPNQVTKNFHEGMWDEMELRNINGDGSNCGKPKQADNWDIWEISGIG